MTVNHCRRVSKIAVLLASFVFSMSAKAIAADATWGWDVYSAGNYSGQINLRDDLNSSITYQRYSSANSPALFGASSSQSPVAVIAGGADLQIDIVRSGVLQTKKVCSGSAVWKVYVTAATACNLGSGTNIGGIHAWAQNNSSTTYTPQLSVYVQGYGWRAIVNNSCGNVQTQQVCE